MKREAATNSFSVKVRASIREALLIISQANVQLTVVKTRNSPDKQVWM